MKKKINYIFCCIVILILSGCSTFYYEKPQKTERYKIGSPYEIRSKKWKLIAVRSSKHSEWLYPQKDKTYRFIIDKNDICRIDTGCNGLLGTMIRNNKKIRFDSMPSTSRLCPAEMYMEESIGKAFNTMDNYIIENDILSLKRGGSVLIEYAAYGE